MDGDGQRPKPNAKDRSALNTVITQNCLGRIYSDSLSPLINATELSTTALDYYTLAGVQLSGFLKQRYGYIPESTNQLTNPAHNIRVQSYPIASTSTQQQQHESFE
jgi:hypothetical protein